MEFKRALTVGVRRHRGFLALILPGAFLRLAGAGYGLPAVFNGDEPHHVGVAISFGRGSLNPGIFKYPTLWMYALFAVYAAGFVLWSGAGMGRSAERFGELFVWQPGVFYLAGRLLAAAFSLGGLWWVYRAGGLVAGRAAGVWAAALLAVSPSMVESAHAAKPESLMFFLAAWSLWHAMAYARLGGLGRLFLCASATGLAVSSQYTAAPLAVLVPTAWWARRLLCPGGGEGPRVLAAALAIVPLAFLAGSPFVLLDAPSFLRDLRDGWAAYGAGHATAAGWRPLVNLAGFSAPWPLGAAAISLGAVWLGRRRLAQAACLVAPCAASVLFLSMQVVGGNSRYLHGAFPAAAILASLGLGAALGRRNPWLKSAAYALLLLPGAWSSFHFDKELILPDTRSMAAEWIREHLPAGARILSDHESDSPRIAMSRDFALRLYEKTRASGHPRQQYYKLMASGHPGGGYEVYQVLREASELVVGPEHARWSSAGRPVLDVRAGLARAREAGMEVVVLTSHGAARNEDEPYVRQTRREGLLLAEFRSESGRIRGPLIEIYRIGPGGLAR